MLLDYQPFVAKLIGTTPGSEWVGRVLSLDFKTTLDRIKERIKKTQPSKVKKSKQEAKKIEVEIVERLRDRTLDKPLLNLFYSQWTEITSIEPDQQAFDTLMHRVLLRLKEIEQDEEDELILMLL